MLILKIQDMAQRCDIVWMLTGEGADTSQTPPFRSILDIGTSAPFYKIPLSRRAFCRIVSLTAAKTSRIYSSAHPP